MRRSPQQTLVRTRVRVPMPADVRHALIGHAVLDAYRQRPPYQQNDYLGWILRAQLEPTRLARIAQMVDELRRGDRYMKMPWGMRQGRQRSA
jgi:uncharacterized protein YdeI (YjbR/CyaY-like superfamily)